MIKRTSKLRIIVIFIVVTIMFFSVVSCAFDNKNNVIRYDDINLYLDNSYIELLEDDIYKRTSNNCANYLPKYESFQFNEFVKAFYVFDGRKTLSHTSISFVLELQFDSLEVYEQFLSYEHKRCEYTNKFDISFNGYICSISTNENITHYYYGEEIPFQFGMLCKNEDKLSIRYIYFRECKGVVDKQFKIVFENTNCNW